MWLKLFILILSIICSKASVQISPNQEVFSVAAGSDVHINCSSEHGVEWMLEPSSSRPQSRVEANVAGNDNNISTLTFTGVQKSSEGKFVCRDSRTRTNATIQLRVFTVTTQDVLYEYKEDAVLNCRVEDNYNFTYSWRKGEEALTDIKRDSKQEFVVHPNGSLEIKNPPRNFAGAYTCIAEYEDADGKKHFIEKEVNYFAHPKVIPFDKSKNLVQDERLVVECKVLGYPKPSITWFKEGEEITGEEKDSQYKLVSAKTYDGTEIEKGKLEIESVGFDDAGEYTCMATSGKWADFNSTQVILVRVKDKLAALWPFLGIVAEVVVLCTIIFIYEKKRNKDAAIEEEANQDGASPEKKAEGVRHRGSPNNPRA